MSVREALESARECLQQWARFAPTQYGPASNVPALVVEQIDAALRELDAAKPEREELVRWVQGYIASILQIDEPSRQLRSMQADIEALNRIAAILRGERDV